jgi:hypothetical protein
VKRLLVAEMGTRETRLYFVKVSVLRVAEEGVWVRM